MAVTTTQLRRRAIKREFVLRLRGNGGFYMEPGVLPYERVRTEIGPELEGTVGYIHSSIEGFNKEYQQLSQSFQIVTQLKNLRAKTIALGRQMTDNLLQRSRAAKTQVFKIGADDDIMLAPAVQLLYNHGELNQLRSDLLELKLYAIDPHTINNLQILKDHETQIIRLKTQTVEQRALEMRQKIESMLNWINEKDPEQQLRQTDLVRFLQETINQLNKQVTPFGLKYKSDIGSKDANFHTKLGYIFESFLEGYFALCTQRGLTENAIMKKLKGVCLNDLKSGVALTLDIQQNITDKLGITTKFGGTNAFGLHAENPVYKTNPLTGNREIVTSRSIQNILASQNITNLQGLNELRYFYDNCVALSIFSSEGSDGTASKTWTGSDRKDETARQRKRGERLLTGSIFRQIFSALADYIYIVLVTQALYGNSVDYNNNATTPLIDSNYIPTLLDKTAKGQHTPPAFLFTSQRVFETGILFNMILNNAEATNEHGKDKIHDSIKALFDAFATRSGYSATAFEELYHEKCEALIGASNSGQTSTIYDTLFNKDIRTIRGFDPFRSWFTRDMALHITFDPSKYIR